jgi:soluble lytic murein transglycosylase-like protein
MKLSKPIGIGLVLLAAQLSAFSAEVAVLRNGFSIHFVRKEQTGNVTRLYLRDGYMDVVTSEIASFEPDDSETPDTAPASQPKAQNSVATQPGIMQPAAVQPNVAQPVANTWPTADQLRAAQAGATQPGSVQSNPAQFTSARFNTTSANAVPSNAAGVFPAPSATKPPSGNISRADLDQMVREASSRYQIDPDFVSSVIKAESNFQSRAVSRKGAQGLMQLMPATASMLGVTNPFDPKANVEGGTAHLSQLLDMYHNDPIKALAAYNAGAHRVDQYHGVPPYWETRAYVARIVRDFNAKKRAQMKTAPSSAQNVKPAKTAKKKASTPAQPQEAGITKPRKPA